MTITATVVATDTQLFTDCTKTKDFACERINNLGVWYINPNSTSSGYSTPIQDDTVVAGQIVVIKVIYDNKTYFLSWDSETTSLADLCDQCCSPEDVTLNPDTITPLQYIQPALNLDCGCAPCSCFFDVVLPPFLSESATHDFQVTLNINGVEDTSTTVHTWAAALAYANANWSAYGTWSLDTETGKLTLVITDCSTLGSIRVTLQEEEFCLDLTAAIGAASKVNYHVMDGYRTNFDTVTVTSATQIKNILAAIYPDGTWSTDAGDIVEYHGVAIPSVIGYDSTTNCVETSTTVATWVTCTS